MIGSLFALAVMAAAPDWQVHTPFGLEARFTAPPGLEWGFFRNADGARIRYSHVPAASTPAKATVVLMPGYSEFAEKYFEVMREFAARGYEVWQMDWRGYGGSDRYLADREKAHSLGAEHDTWDLDQFARTVVRRVPGRPFVLVAHSMGGLYAVRYLHDHPGVLTSAVLSAPFLSMPPGGGAGMPDWLARAVVVSAAATGFADSYAKGSGPWRDRIVPKLTHDEVRGALQLGWNRTSPVLRIGGVTYGWVRESLRSFDLIQEQGYLAAIQTPVLLGSAYGDVLTRPDAQARACVAMGRCRLMTFPGAYHELFMESDAYRSRWMNAIFAFIEVPAGR
jgi:lysophospholipase